jgi:hypothetical protein
MNSPNVGRDAHKVQQNKEETRGSSSHGESWWMLCCCMVLWKQSDCANVYVMYLFSARVVCCREISVYCAMRASSQMCSFDILEAKDVNRGLQNPTLKKRCRVCGLFTSCIYVTHTLSKQWCC